MIEEISWAAAIGLAIAIVWVPIFAYHLVAGPPRRDRNQRDQIADLKKKLGAGTETSPSFDLFLDEVRQDEARGILDSDRDYWRIGLTNLTPQTLDDCRVVIEGSEPWLKTVPSQHLVWLGHTTNDKDKFSLASGETKYLWFLSRELSRWGGDLAGPTALKLGGYMGYEYVPLEANQYVVEIAAYASSAVSRRLAIRVQIDPASGVPTAKAESNGKRKVSKSRRGAKTESP